MKKLRIIAGICLVLFSLFSINLYADVGNKVSRSKSKSSSVSNSSSNSVSNSRSYSSNGYSSSSGGGINAGTIFFIILIVGGYIVYAKFFKSKVDNSLNSASRSIQDNIGNTTQINHDTEIIEKIRYYDPEFSKAKFISRVNNMFMQLQDAWMKKSWKTVRVFETDSLYNIHAKQLQQFIDSRKTNMITDIDLQKTTLLDYIDDCGAAELAGFEFIEVQIDARLRDYVVDDTSTKVLEGSPDEDIYMKYKWTLMRTRGVKSKTDDSGTKVDNCPNCGANISINASGECEYCGSVVSNGQHDWVLYSIETLDQS